MGRVSSQFERDLGDGLARLLGNYIKRINDLVKVFFFDHGATFGTALPEPATRRQWLTATNLPCQAAPAERAPHQRADLLVETQRHELPLIGRGPTSE